MSAELSSVTVPFLGTLAGVPKYLPGLDGQMTYARQYEPFGQVFVPSEGMILFREKISRILSDGGSDAFKSHGEAFSYTPFYMSGGRAFGTVPSSEYQGGGYFLVVKSYESEDQRRFRNCMEYALRIFETRIKEQYQESLDDVKYPGEALQFNQLVKKYFMPIPYPELPKDGDLVVYENPLGTYHNGRSIAGSAHAGIYRESPPNWNSSHGGTVESKWGWLSCHHVYEHEVFLAPHYYGDTVTFYRFREKV